ncbi:MAG TPA: hypothetical protein V6C91_14945 [Coleofasciculaceae cyanobacterium]
MRIFSPCSPKLLENLPSVYLVYLVGTVRLHAILQNLKVCDRTQAAVLAIQKGLVAAALFIH